MATTERSTLHGRPMQGPTTGRPANAYAGQTYYDETAHVMLYFDGNTDQWRPMGVAAEFDEPTMPAAMLPIRGLEFAGNDGSTWISDGVVAMRPAEEPESSSSSPSSGE